MKALVNIVFIFILIVPSLHAQDKEYRIFKEIIQELHLEAQAKKDVQMAAHEKSSQEVKPYQNRKPQVSVIGAPKDEAEKIVHIIEEALVEEQTGKNIKNKEKKTPKKNDGKIKFKQVYMEEGKGDALTPTHTQTPRKIEWMSTETETFTYEEIIDDSDYSPEQRKESKIIGTHNSNTLELNRIGFIQAIHKETQTQAGYKKFKTDLKSAGHDLDSIIRRSFFLSNQEQNNYIKSKLNQIIDAVMY